MGPAVLGPAVAAEGPFGAFVGAVLAAAAGCGAPFVGGVSDAALLARVGSDDLPGLVADVVADACFDEGRLF